MDDELTLVDNGDEYTVYRNGVPVDFIGWAGTDITGGEDDAYHFTDFFGADGKYLGPDHYGLYPVFM